MTVTSLSAVVVVEAASVLTISSWVIKIFLVKKCKIFKRTSKLASNSSVGIFASLANFFISFGNSYMLPLITHYSFLRKYQEFTKNFLKK